MAYARRASRLDGWGIAADGPRGTSDASEDAAPRRALRDSRCEARRERAARSAADGVMGTARSAPDDGAGLIQYQGSSAQQRSRTARSQNERYSWPAEGGQGDRAPDGSPPTAACTRTCSLRAITELLREAVGSTSSTCSSTGATWRHAARAVIGKVDAPTDDQGRYWAMDRESAGNASRAVRGDRRRRRAARSIGRGGDRECTRGRLRGQLMSRASSARDGGSRIATRSLLQLPARRARQLTGA